MKKIYKDKILNVEGTDVFDHTFLFEYLLLSPEREVDIVEIIYLRDVLKHKKNLEVLERVKEKPAMYSEVYSPKNELEIFTKLFENAIKNNRKTHIIWVTLREEINMLEEYYGKLWFMREDINAFDVDFSVPLVTVSCHIENLIWKGSDYKAQRENIFFCPPIRESGQNKALFKGVTRGVIAGIDISPDSWESGIAQKFIWDCIRNEKILPLHMWKVLKYNIEEIWLKGEHDTLEIVY